jgi:HAD superfamily hydrolase (TIGR01509 family)
LAICTTTSRSNINALISAALGAEGLALFETIVCGEDVRHKKPSPEAYLRVLEDLGVEAHDCLAFEDSHNGLRAAMAANLRTVITPSLFTADESCEGATRVLRDLDRFELSEFD